MHNAPQLFPVPFHGDTVVLVGQDNEPYVAMKPIATNMGLDWETQLRKLSDRFETTTVKMTVVAEDGRLRDMVCLPLKKLPAWLYSISPNKVASELREKIIRYQEECDDALWNYWTQGVAERPGAASTASKQIALSRHRLALLKELYRTRDRALRSAVHEQLAQVSQALGLSLPELDSIGRADLETPDLLKEFWEAVAYPEGKGERCNHAVQTLDEICLNLPELQRLFDKHSLDLRVDHEVRQALRTSDSPQFVETGIFTSKKLGKKIRGWRFLSKF